MFSLINTLVILTIVIVVFWCDLSSSQANGYFLPEITCPSFFQYAFVDNRTIGIIKINGVGHGKTKINVELSQPGAYDLTFVGKLSLNFDKNKAFEYINSGRPLTYKVEFPFDNIIPRVTAIYVNNEKVCTGLKYDLPSTTIKLEHSLTTYPINALSNFEPGYWQQDALNQGQDPYRSPFSGPVSQVPSSSSLVNSPALVYNDQTNFDPSLYLNPVNQEIPEQPVANQLTSDLAPILTRQTEKLPTITTSPVIPPDHKEFEYINSICGQENTNFDIKRLNIKGSPIIRSRFPWIVAVLKDVRQSFTFQCGGSLISKRTVISSAHCFYSEFGLLGPEDILVSMGLHELTEWWNANNMRVENVIHHPDYKHKLLNFDADLAVLRLKESVTFTTSIRPICMWQGSTNIRDIEGVSGAIVGWGSDGERQTTSVPTLVSAKIVSESTCLRSNEQFISITSNRTLCAGNLDGSGPCTGDSGNGLMIKKSNKWMLRGTVSAALGSPTKRCNLDQYTIFSDTGKFSEWIRLNMLL